MGSSEFPGHCTHGRQQVPLLAFPAGCLRNHGRPVTSNAPSAPKSDKHASARQVRGHACAPTEAVQPADRRFRLHRSVSVRDRRRRRRGSRRHLSSTGHLQPWTGSHVLATPSDSPNFRNLNSLSVSRCAAGRKTETTVSVSVPTPHFFLSITFHHVLETPFVLLDPV